MKILLDMYAPAIKHLEIGQTVSARHRSSGCQYKPKFNVQVSIKVIIALLLIGI